MQIISAALAFAITMLVLSMVVSVLVETIHRIFGMRERGLLHMLGRLYDDVLGDFARPAGTTREDFQDRISENRAPILAATQPAGPARTTLSPARTSLSPARTSLSSAPSLRTLADIWDWLGANWRGRGLSTLGVAGFMERLGSLPLGDGIVQRAKNLAQPATPNTPAGTATPPDLDQILQDIAQKFESYASDASVFFERRARTLSVLVAFVLAFVLHVNAVEIFATFMRDPAVTEAVISRLNQVTGEFESQRSETEQKKAQAPAAPSGHQLQTFQELTKDMKDLKKEYDATLKKLKDTENQLSSLGVPIGWTDQRKQEAGFPASKQFFCTQEGKPNRDVSKPEECGKDEKSGSRLVYHIRIPNWNTLLGLLLGGLLVGLGSPFWYQTVTSIASIRNITRTASGTQAAAPPPTPAEPVSAKEAPQPRTPVDIFKTAHAGRVARASPP